MYVQDIFFEDAVAHSIRCTKFLRQEQVCDVVMALTHVSVTQDIDIAEAALAVGTSCLVCSVQLCDVKWRFCRTSSHPGMYVGSHVYNRVLASL